jgi:hypothetical protein
MMRHHGARQRNREGHGGRGALISTASRLSLIGPAKTGTAYIVTENVTTTIERMIFAAFFIIISIDLFERT